MKGSCFWLCMKEFFIFSSWTVSHILTEFFLACCTLSMYLLDFLFSLLDIAPTLRNILHPICGLTLMFKTAVSWGEEGKGRRRFYMCMYIRLCLYVCVYMYTLHYSLYRKIQLHLVSSVNAMKKYAGLLKLFLSVFLHFSFWKFKSDKFDAVRFFLWLWQRSCVQL